MISACKGKRINSSCKGRSIVDMPCWIKADGTMLIVAIDSHTTIRGGGCKGRSIRSSCKGNSIVDVPCSLVVYHPFVLQESICACSMKNFDSCLPVGFHWQFFCEHAPDIISIMKNKKTSSQNKISIKFYLSQWTVDDFRRNNMATPY